jgi:hypothetical protein
MVKYKIQHNKGTGRYRILACWLFFRFTIEKYTEGCFFGDAREFSSLGEAKLWLHNNRRQPKVVKEPNKWKVVETW